MPRPCPAACGFTVHGHANPAPQVATSLFLHHLETIIVLESGLETKDRMRYLPQNEKDTIIDDSTRARQLLSDDLSATTVIATILEALRRLSS